MSEKALRAAEFAARNKELMDYCNPILEQQDLITKDNFSDDPNDPTIFTFFGSSNIEGQEMPATVDASVCFNENTNHYEFMLTDSGDAFRYIYRYAMSYHVDLPNKDIRNIYNVTNDILRNKTGEFKDEKVQLNGGNVEPIAKSKLDIPLLIEDEDSIAILLQFESVNELDAKKNVMLNAINITKKVAEHIIKKQKNLGDF